MAERVIAVARARAKEDEVQQALHPAGVAQAGEQFGEVAGKRLAGGAEVLDPGQERLQRGERGAGHLGARAEALEELFRAAGEGGQMREGLVDPGRGDFEVAKGGRRLVGEASQAVHRGAELAQEGREVDEVLLQRAALARRGLGDGVGLDDEVGDPLAHRREGRQRAV